MILLRLKLRLAKESIINKIIWHLGIKLNAFLLQNVQIVHKIFHIEDSMTFSLHLNNMVIESGEKDDDYWRAIEKV